MKTNWSTRTAGEQAAHEDAAEWREWLALSKEERAARLGRARGEVDVHGYTTNRLLAGKALHGHPARFTWEDVDRHREMAAECRATHPAASAWHDSLADRIAALLPPR